MEEIEKIGNMNHLGRRLLRDPKKKLETVGHEDFLNFIEYVTKRPYKNIPTLFAVTPLYNILVQF